MWYCRVYSQRGRVVEVSPSGDFVKLDFDGAVCWKKSIDVALMEVLETDEDGDKNGNL